MKVSQKSHKQGRSTLIIGLVAGLCLIVGVIFVFDLPSGTVGGTLAKLIVGLLVMMLFAFLAAGVITLIKRLLAKRH